MARTSVRADKPNYCKVSGRWLHRPFIFLARTGVRADKPNYGELSGRRQHRP
ncbi:MAG: hypothetical protein WDA22_05530 [Bacteroidota bacterium]